MADLNQIGSDLSNAPLSYTQRPDTLNQTYIPPASSTFQQAAQNRMASNRTIVTQAVSDAIPKYFFILNLYDYSPQVGGQPGNYTTRNWNGGIILPIPQNLVDSQSVSYSEQPLGPAIGGIVQSNAENIKNAFVSAAQGNFGSALDITKRSLANTDIGTAGVALATQGLAGLAPTEVLAAGSAVAGAAINQFKTVLLSGPEYKIHSFDFFLAPKNQTESENIRLIVRRLRAAMAPSLSASKIFWLFPQVVIPLFYPQQNDPNETKMYAFKPSVIMNISANYAPGGTAAFYKTEYPEAISLRITLKEIEYWLSQDYGGRPNGGGV